MKKIIFFINLIILISFVFLILPCDKDLYCYGVAGTSLPFFLWPLSFFLFTIIGSWLSLDKYKKLLKHSIIFILLSQVFVYKFADEGGCWAICFDQEYYNFLTIFLYGIYTVVFLTIQYIKQHKEKKLK